MIFKIGMGDILILSYVHVRAHNNRNGGFLSSYRFHTISGFFFYRSRHPVVK